MARTVPLARRNLLAERGRFAMSIAGVGFAVLLVLIVVSLYRGWSDVGRLYERLPGEVWVSQPATSDPFHSTSFLPTGYGETLGAIAGVNRVIPVYARHIAFPGPAGDLDVFAMAFASPGATGGAGRPYLPPEGGIEIDRILAGQAGVGIGDTLRVLGRDLAVVRIHEGGNSIFQTAFLNGSDARTLFGLEGYVNFFTLELERGANTETVAADVARTVTGAETHLSSEFARRFADRVNSGFLAVVSVLVAIGLVVGGAIVALTTYTATAEKAREFGVLKAVGASAGFLYRIVLQQSVAVGLLGSVLGISAAVLTTSFVERAVPEFITDLRLTDTTLVFAAAIGMAVAASYVPVRRINRIDPGIVFRA